MAHPSATAAFLFLVALSLLAAAHCRTVAVAADHAAGAEPKPTAAVAVAFSDENGLSSSSNPTHPAAEKEEILPADPEQQHGFAIEFLRLPSSHRLHRNRHRPCSLHGHHLWWKRRHHGVHRDAPRRFGHGGESHLAAGEAEEANPVADPADADRHEHDDGERAAAVVRAWKKEVLRRWLQSHLHHGMRRHHHVHHDDDGDEEEAAPEGMNMKQLRFRLHDDDEEDEQEKNVMSKRRLRRHAEHGEDSDDEEEEDERVDEMVRQFGNAIMRRRRFGQDNDDDEEEGEDERVDLMMRRFRNAITRRRSGHGHGRRFFHHEHGHRHRHAEEAEKQQAGGRGEEQSGVTAWIKRLMNRF